MPPKKNKDGIDSQLYEDLRTQIVVKGAGGKRGKFMNGKYDLDGTLNGRNKYKHVDGKGFLFFDQTWKLSGDDNWSTWEYKNTTELEAELVPENNWQAEDPDQEPAPTVVDEWLKRWESVRVFRRLHAAELAEHTDTILGMTKDAKDMVRWESVTILGRLQHEHLERVADPLTEIIANEPKESVREAAIKVLLKLDPVDLAKHAPQICAILEDESSFVRLWALLAIDKLETEEKCKYEEYLIKRKEDSYMPVREKAGQLLRAHHMKMGVAKDGDAVE